MIVSIKSRRRIAAGVSLLAVMTAFSVSARAAEEEEKGDAIVVTGQRAADRNAISTKKSAIQIVDAISADDIGQMADASVGDALRRIAGVNTYNYQGEPRFATIRGFNAHYLTTTLDGMQVASPDNQNQTNGGGRQFYLESLPSNIASRIEVYKTSTPSMDGHSIGGTINFALPHARDFTENQFQISGKYGVQILDGSYGGNRPTGQAEIFLTRKFGADDRFGIALSGSYWRRSMYIPQLEQGSSAYWYLPTGTNSNAPYVGTGPVGTERRWYVYDDTRTRKSLLGTFDWEISDRISFTLTSYYFDQNETAFRNDTIASIGAGAIVSNQTATSGTLSPARAADISQNVRLFQLYFNRKIYGGQSGLHFDATDRFKVDARLAYSRATYDNPQISDYFVQNGLAFNYEEGPDGVTYTPVNSTAYNNLSAYVGGSGASTPQHFEERYTTKADHYEGQLKAAYNADPHDRGLGITVGISGISNTRAEAYSRTYQNGMAYTLADVASSDRICSLNCSAGGLFLIDYNKLQDVLATNLPGATAVVDTAGAFGRAYRLREDVYAGYGELVYRADNWSFVGGLRYEQTDFVTTGFRALTRRAGSITTTVHEPARSRAFYGHLLPSATISYDAAPDIRLRAAYSRTIGRPKYTDMAQLGGALNVTNPALPTLRTGNPDLKPRVSDNFDAIFEWYLDRGQGLFTLGAFYKNVKNEIYLLGREETIDLGEGVSALGVVTSPVNATGATRVRGFEANLTKYFTFLPGFLSRLGMNANGIVTWTNFPIQLADGTPVTLHELPNQARFVSNVALFYETDKFHARVAWNHTGKFIEERFVGTGTSSAANLYRIRWVLPTDTVDASVSYDIDERFTVRLDATNLTGAGVNTNIGADREIPLARQALPTAVMAGFSARF